MERFGRQEIEEQDAGGNYGRYPADRSQFGGADATDPRLVEIEDHEQAKHKGHRHRDDGPRTQL